jgi:hypothetical protein
MMVVTSAPSSAWIWRLHHHFHEISNSKWMLCIIFWMRWDDLGSRNIHTFFPFLFFWMRLYILVGCAIRNLGGRGSRLELDTWQGPEATSGGPRPCK